MLAEKGMFCAISTDGANESDVCSGLFQTLLLLLTLISMVGLSGCWEMRNELARRAEEKAFWALG